ncbi:MAG: GNAT family N-acetyltransferase [Sphaerochaetaceae bacterium]|nr:GNAT family N-acetyltransferase [Sphaerochaetaceae bacterium]
MDEKFINLSLDNIHDQHLCCAISDKKHQCGVDVKKQWLKDRLREGHVFRKLDANGKVFIEYAPLETAWVPVVGENYLYIYCLWVSGAFKGKGYAKALLEYCLRDARAQGKSGVCVLSAQKKKPFLSEKRFMLKYGFEVADTTDEGYELLALSFDGTMPHFTDSARRMSVPFAGVTIYHGMQCPYIPNCVEQVRLFCEQREVPLQLIAVDSLEKAKAVPCVFNNWAVFRDGKFESVQLMNEGAMKKLLGL